MSDNQNQDLGTFSFIESVKQQKPSIAQENAAQENLMAMLDTIEVDSNDAAKSTSWWIQIQELLGFLANKKQLSIIGSFAAIACISALLMFSSGVTSPAFAAVVEKLKGISSMYYKGTMQVQGQNLMTLDVYYLAPDKLRIVNTPTNASHSGPSVINVLNTSKGKGLIILPQADQAMPFDFEPGKVGSNDVENKLFAWRDTIINYEGEVEQLPAKNIDGVMASGYVLVQDQISITLWVNPQTELPIRMLLNIVDGNANNTFEFEASTRFNISIDEDLFDTSLDNYQEIKSDEN